MRRLALLIVTFVMVLLASTASVVASAGPAAASGADDEFAFLTLLNQHRQAAGLPGLTMSTALSDSARAHSGEMAAAGSIFHTANLAAVAAAAAPNWRSAGENVGVGGSVSVLDTALMNSAPHRANMLGAYNYVGIGVAYKGAQVYVTQMFVSTTTPIAARPAPGSPTPIGSFDSTQRSFGDLTVQGWALDPDTSASIGVHIYIDGSFATSTVANLDRPDLAGFGRGNAHGFRAVVHPPPGVHTVCAYALNDAPGANPVVGCRAVDMAAWPVGSLDSATQWADGILVSGWAVDPDTAAALSVHIYVDGQFTAVVPAANARPDIGAAFPGYGAAHGYTAHVNAAPGWHVVCVYAINAGPGGNSLLPCRSVYIGANPYGSLDTASPTAGDLRVTGWLIDPSTAAPIDGHLYLDGRFVEQIEASDDRPDLARFGYGNDHGFDLQIPVDGGNHQVCLFGINVGVGASPLIRCVDVSVASDPVGSLDGAAGDPVSVMGWAIDPNTKDPINVKIMVDGSTAKSVLANKARPDLAPYYPAFGTSHGFNTSVTVNNGTHQVCAVAVNDGSGADRLLSCRSVQQPIGS